MPEKPRQVERCTTHYVGCACHEWRADEMAKALRIILVWAACYDRSAEDPRTVLADIVDKCNEALGATK